MSKRAPDKTFLRAPTDGAACDACSECPHMRLNTLEKLYDCMRDRRPEIVLEESVRLRALGPIERMLEISA
jgi:quinolinate synthase